MDKESSRRSARQAKRHPRLFKKSRDPILGVFVLPEHYSNAHRIFVKRLSPKLDPGEFVMVASPNPIMTVFYRFQIFPMDP